MCAFDAWVKEAETFPVLTETLNDIVDVDADVAWTYVLTHVHVRSHHPITNIELMEVMVGYTVIQAESAIKAFQKEVADFEFAGGHGGGWFTNGGWFTADHASDLKFLVQFLRGLLCQKEHSLLVPWIEKLDGYGREVHKLCTTHRPQHARPALVFLGSATAAG
jgi:hypothetical protein